MKKQPVPFSFQMRAICHRGYVLETGTVILDGEASDLTGNDLVRQAYLGG